MLWISLFPPYNWISMDKDRFIVNKSYQFLFSDDVTRGYGYIPANREINISELLIEYFLAIIFWGTVYFLFSKSKKGNND